MSNDIKFDAEKIQNLFEILYSKIEYISKIKVEIENTKKNLNNWKSRVFSIIISRNFFS